MQSIRLFWIFLCISCASAQMSAIGQAYEGFNPCPNGVLSMSRFIGGGPIKENYWNGTLYLDKWPNLSEIRIALTVDNPARIEIDSEVGIVLVEDRTFYITAYGRQPDVDKVNFIIRGTQRGAFPNPTEIKLNNEVICKDPEKVKMHKIRIKCSKCLMMIFNVLVATITAWYIGRSWFDGREKRRTKMWKTLR